MGRPKSDKPAKVEKAANERIDSLQQAVADGMREVCTGCALLRPVSAFAVEVVRDETGAAHRRRAEVCDRCAEEGAEGADDPVAWELINPRHRKLIKAVFEMEVGFEQAKLDAGYQNTRATLLDLVGQSPQSRKALQAILRANGLHSLSLAKHLRAALRATRAQYNPALQTWDLFPDHNARNKALDLLAKLHDLMPHKKTAEVPTSVSFHTNIFEAPRDEKDVTPSGAYVLEAEKGAD